MLNNAELFEPLFVAKNITNCIVLYINCDAFTILIFTGIGRPSNRFYHLPINHCNFIAFTAFCEHVIAE